MAWRCTSDDDHKDPTAASDPDSDPDPDPDPPVNVMLVPLSRSRMAGVISTRVFMQVHLNCIIGLVVGGLLFRVSGLLYLCFYIVTLQDCNKNGLCVFNCM